MGKNYIREMLCVDDAAIIRRSSHIIAIELPHSVGAMLRQGIL